MKITELPFVRGFIRMIADASGKGWHERNGGNLSYRIRPEEISGMEKGLSRAADWINIGISVPDLAGEYFLITGAGKYFRNVSLFPENNIGLILIDDKGENYRIIWGLEDGAKPTSELPTHLLTHAIKKRKAAGHRVVYHAHPSNMIALSFLLPLTDYAFTRELWGMITECPLVFPEGVGVVGWMVPGGREIALATGKLMEKRSVVLWAHHGVFCSGLDFDDTFGLMDTVEKSAEISLKVRSAGGAKQTVTTEQLREIAANSKIKINEEFLK